jgi:hypothetical protein
LRQSFHTHTWIDRKQCRVFTNERRGLFQQRPAIQQGIQIGHLCPRKRVGLRIVLAQADAVKENKKDFHVMGL